MLDRQFSQHLIVRRRVRFSLINLEPDPDSLLRDMAVDEELNKGKMKTRMRKVKLRRLNSRRETAVKGRVITSMIVCVVGGWHRENLPDQPTLIAIALIPHCSLHTSLLPSIHFLLDPYSLSHFILILFLSLSLSLSLTYQIDGEDSQTGYNSRPRLGTHTFGSASSRAACKPVFQVAERIIRHKRAHAYATMDYSARLHHAVSKT